MDSVSCPTESAAPRPTRPLPATAGLTAAEREQTASTGSPDLGGTLVSHPPDALPELSSASEDEDGAGSGSKRRKGNSKPAVPRRQIKIEYIQDKSRRNITFGKRKHGIFKKALEISTLTGCEVMLVVAPKDSELNAYTFATPRLAPLIKEPAGEAYIQNCLRYGALMPGTSSGMSAAYGPSGPINQSPHVGTLRMGPRPTLSSNANAISYNSSYAYVHNGGIARRTQPPHGMPHPLSLSPQSSPPTNMTSKQTPQSAGLPDQTRREASDSPVQHLGIAHHAGKQQQWSPGPNVSKSEFPLSPAVTAPNSAMGSSSREIPADWIVANPRSLFQTSSPLGPTPISTRGLSSYPLSTPTAGSGNGYSHLPPDSNPFHRQSSDSSVIATPTWPSASQNSPGIRTSPAQNLGGSSNAPTNDPRFLEPLVLSQPYDSRAMGSSDEYSAGSNYPHPIPSLSMQSCVPYGEGENCHGASISTAYLQDQDGSGPETENKHYVLDNPDHGWSTGL